MTFDEQKYRKVVENALQLAKSRQVTYGDSVSIMRDESIADLVLMKMLRLRTLQKTDQKYEDELLDCLNYVVFLLSRTDQAQLQKPEQKPERRSFRPVGSTDI
jgi:hypothetical protein